MSTRATQQTPIVVHPAMNIADTGERHSCARYMTPATGRRAQLLNASTAAERPQRAAKKFATKKAALSVTAWR